MVKRLHASFFLVALTVAVTRAFGQEPSPEDTLKRYLAALQGQDFAKAYDLVSRAMRTDSKSGQVRTREAWVKWYQYIFAGSEVKIFDFKVLSGKVKADEAIVPNILSSQDKFVNQLGREEYELYTLVKEDGTWKVDRQEEVVEPDEIATWFQRK